MKVLAIVCVMCIAHLASGRNIGRTDLDVFGLGRDNDDKINFHTSNIRSKNINNRNPFKDDDQTVNVVQICNRRNLNDINDQDWNNDIGDRFARNRNERYNRYDRDYNNRYDRYRNDRDLNDFNDRYRNDRDLNDFNDRYRNDRDLIDFNDRYRNDRDLNDFNDRYRNDRDLIDFNDRYRNDRDLNDRYNMDRDLNGRLDWNVNDRYDRDGNDRDDRDNKDCVVLQIKGKKKHTNHVAVVVVKDNDPDQEIRNNNLNDDNVVFVTVNKKLGSYTRKDINDDDIVGKADIKDTIGALTWVHRNIHKYGGDRHQVILVLGRKTSRIGDVLKNTKYDGNLYRQIILQTMDNDNKNTIKNQIKWDIANEAGCLNVNNQDDIDNCLKFTSKMRLDDAKRRIKQKFGGDLNDNSRLFGIDNRDLLNNDLRKNLLLKNILNQQYRFDDQGNDRDLTFNLRNKLIGGRNDRFDDLDDIQRGGLRNRNFEINGINDIWNNIGRQGFGRVF